MWAGRASPMFQSTPPRRGRPDQHLIDQLKRHEGTKRDLAGFHVAYRCTSGCLTIGYGHNLDANPIPGVTASSRLSEDQAERLLITDINKASSDLAKLRPWTSALDPARRSVLINMLFNLGPQGLLSFSNTLALIKAGDYAGAARNMLASKWASQVGRRATELAKQMETGEWQ